MFKSEKKATNCSVARYGPRTADVKTSSSSLLYDPFIARLLKNYSSHFLENIVYLGEFNHRLLTSSTIASNFTPTGRVEITLEDEKR